MARLIVCLVEAVGELLGNCVQKAFAQQCLGE